jgi:uncharacterized membrane protein
MYIIAMSNRTTFKKEFGLIIVGAVIFTASFLWKDLISDIEELYFPKQYGIMGRVMFTILVTIILIMIAVHMKNYWGLNQPIRFDDDPTRNSNESNVDFSMNHDT